MATQLESQFIQQFLDTNGLLVGGSVYFYAAGSTTTLQAIYTSSAGTTELSNPQTLGSLGELQNVVYLSGNYNLVVKDVNGVPKFQRDNFDATASSRSVSDFMLEAQAAGTVIGGWSLVQAQSVTVTLAAGDIVFGDTDGALYQLTGDGAQDPEADSYNVNTGVGTDWIKLAIANAPITQSNLDTIDATIAALSATINNRGYKSGMYISNGTDSDHDINISVGTCQDSTGVYRMTQTSAFVKAIDDNWAEGTAQGGRPVGVSLTNNTVYYFFAIGKTTSVTATDYGFDTDPNAVNLLNGSNAGAQGYTLYRQIGYAVTDGSANIRNFVRNGDLYLWAVANLDYAQQLGATSAQTITSINPPNTLGLINVCAKNDATSLGATSFLLVTGTDQTDTTPSDTAYTIKYIKDTGFVTTESSECLIPIDSSRQYRARADASGFHAQLFSVGYYYDPTDI